MSNQTTATPLDDTGHSGPKGSIPRNNDATLRGNIGSGPVTQKTQSGAEMVRARMAVNMAAPSVAPEERGRFTEWYTVIAFAPAQMERLRKVVKGELVCISGPVTLHSYQATDGERIERTQIAEYVRSASSSMPPDVAVAGDTKSNEPPSE